MEETLRFSFGDKVKSTNLALVRDTQARESLEAYSKNTIRFIRNV